MLRFQESIPLHQFPVFLDRVHIYAAEGFDPGLDLGYLLFESRDVPELFISEFHRVAESNLVFIPHISDPAVHLFLETFPAVVEPHALFVEGVDLFGKRFLSRDLFLHRFFKFVSLFVFGDERLSAVVLRVFGTCQLF